MTLAEVIAVAMKPAASLATPTKPPMEVGTTLATDACADAGRSGGGGARNSGGVGKRVAERQPS